MKAGRVSFAAALLACYLFFPGKAAQLVASLILLSGLLSLAYSTALKNGLIAYRIVRELRVSRFDRLELVVTVENGSFLPAPICYLADAPGILSVAAEDGRWAISLGAHETANLRYSVIGNARGEYAVGPLRLVSGDPLGLFPFEKTIEDRCIVLVRPTRVDLSLALDSGIPQGNLGVRDRRYEDVTLYRSVRDYAAGDELRRINWKSSARFGRLFTNDYQASLSSPIFVYVDLFAPRYPLHLRHDHAESLIEIAAALVTIASTRAQRCGFASSGSLPAPSGAQDGQGAKVAARPYASIAASQGECILDILARIALTENESEGEDDGEGLLARALCALPVGGRFFIVSPDPPANLASAGFSVRKIAEYVHEAARR